VANGVAIKPLPKGLRRQILFFTDYVSYLHHSFSSLNTQTANATTG